MLEYPFLISTTWGKSDSKTPSATSNSVTTPCEPDHLGFCLSVFEAYKFGFACVLACIETPPKLFDDAQTFEDCNRVIHEIIEVWIDDYVADAKVIIIGVGFFGVGEIGNGRRRKFCKAV